MYTYFLPIADGLCASALPAADLESAEVLPSLKVFDAADAAGALVTFFGALVCDRAEPAAVLELSPVDFGRITLDAFEAAVGCVVLEFFVMANLLSLFS